MEQRISLNGIWQMKRTDETDPMKAAVPGTVMAAMLENDRIPDPFYRENEKLVKPCFDHDYEYQRSFSVPEEYLDQERIVLVFEGLDTLAEVWLNGTLILKADNMHRTWRVDVKHVLVHGENHIHIRFSSPNRYIAERIAGADVNFPAGGCMEGNNYIRKCHSMFGWDWGPQLPDCGIWRDVYLTASSGAYITDIYPVQRHENGTVRLAVNVGISGLRQEHTDTPFILSAVLTAPDGRSYRAETNVPSGVNVRDRRMEAGERMAGYGAVGLQKNAEDTLQYSLLLAVEDPLLWWPNGLGEHPLYDLAVTLRADHPDSALRDKKRLRIGLRTIAVSQEIDADGKGAEFTFVVNGCKIFAAGSNYIPEDAFLSRMSEARTRKLLASCTWANFNMIRVWGGGYYPPDYFFDACDEYGILVWQDLMFACNVYEFDQAFEETTTAEIIDNVRRIRHHASLALWCGNNEMEWGWNEWFPVLTPSVARRNDYTVMFEYVYKKLLEKYDPQTLYKESSPSSNHRILKEGKTLADHDPNCDNIGDTHYYGVWLNRAPILEYRKHRIRFCSEFGFQSLPSQKTLAAVTEEADRNLFSPVMENLQKCDKGNGLILYYLAETYRYPKDFASLIYVTQLLHAYAMSCAVEHFRRNRPYSMGALYWQLNDVWPGSSGSSVDYYGRYKALHYAARHFFAPFTASILDEGSRMALYVENESRQQRQYRMVCRVKDMENDTLFEREITGSIAPFSVEKVFEEDFAGLVAGRERETYFSYRMYECGGPGSSDADDIGGQGSVALYAGDDADSRFLCSDTAFFTAVKYLELPEVVIRAKIFESEEEFVIILSADAFAYKVMLDLKNDDAVFSDNYISLTGEPVQVSVPKKELPEGMTASKLEEELTVFSLRDTY